MVRPVARIAVMVIVRRKWYRNVAILRSRLQRSCEIPGPSRRHEFRARVALNRVFQLVKGDAVDGVVAGKRGVQLVLDHPFDGVLEVFLGFLVGVPGEFEGHIVEAEGSAESVVRVVHHKVFIVFVVVVVKGLADCIGAWVVFLAVFCNFTLGFGVMDDMRAGWTSTGRWT